MTDATPVTLSREHGFGPAGTPHASQQLTMTRAAAPPAGVVFCFNRPCSVQAVAWPQAGPAADGGARAVCLTRSLGSAFSPRFSPDGTSLVFLSQQNAISTGVHSATVTLHSLQWGDAAAALAGSMAPPPRTGEHVYAAWKLRCTEGSAAGTCGNKCSERVACLAGPCSAGSHPPAATLPPGCERFAGPAAVCSGGHRLEPGNSRGLPGLVLCRAARAALPAGRAHAAADHAVAQVGAVFM